MIGLWYSAITDALIFLLLMHRAWLAIPCPKYFSIFFTWGLVAIVLLAGDIDNLAPGVDFGFHSTPSLRSLIARTGWMTGLLIPLVMDLREYLFEREEKHE